MHTARLGILGACLLLLCNVLTVRSEAQVSPTTNKAYEPQPFELQVVGPDGKPVPDATVTFRTPLAPVPKPVPRGEFVRPGAYGAVVKTDGEGRLTVLRPAQAERLVVMIQQPGYGPYWAAWESRGHPENIPDKFVAELDAGWPVGGVVVDGDGNPVEGATVDTNMRFKKRPGDTQELGVGTEAVTDAEGRWRYDCVPDSMREVFVSIDHRDFMPERRVLTRSEFGIELSATPAAKIPLKRGVMVTGTVTDESGKPIADAVVYSQFLNENRQAETASDGTYFLAGCEPRMARIVVRAKGRALDMKEVRVEPGMDPVDFTLKPGGKIRVRVVDENGKPLPGARIFFQRWRGHIDYFEFEHVNQYTGADGVWRWDEAPLDEFKADICPPNGMQLEKQSLVARDGEYVFKRVPLLVISGKVIDAESKEPIDNFRVVPGNRWEDRRMFWSQNESYQATDGSYRMTRNGGNTTHMIRVEANGYQAATSREISFDEGNVMIDFELKKGQNIAAMIEQPDGTPAAGAKVAVGVGGSQINVNNGDIDDGSTYAARFIADDVGRISIPPPDSQFQLVITHPSGFAHHKSSEAVIPEAIKLTPWARIGGVFRVGQNPAANVTLNINTNTMHSYGEDLPSIFTHHETTTGANGSFVFERVLPGKGRIGRRIVFMVDDGATEVTSSKMVSLQLEAGETTHIELGGDGRAVVGRLAPPAGHNANVLWNFAMIRMRAALDQPKPAEPPADEQNDRERYQAWWKEWTATEEGKAWRTKYEAYETQRDAAPYFTASVARDGSFRIDDVPAGDYALDVDLSGRAPIRLSNYRVSVPTIETEQPDQPIDLGILALEKSQ
jgi:uncharacterized GH25 family protein